MSRPKDAENFDYNSGVGEVGEGMMAGEDVSASLISSQVLTDCVPSLCKRGYCRSANRCIFRFSEL